MFFQVKMLVFQLKIVYFQFFQRLDSNKNLKSIIYYLTATVAINSARLNTTWIADPSEHWHWHQLRTPSSGLLKTLLFFFLLPPPFSFLDYAAFCYLFCQIAHSLTLKLVRTVFLAVHCPLLPNRIQTYYDKYVHSYTYSPTRNSHQ